MVASETDTFALFASVLQQTGGNVERVSTPRQVAALIGDAARRQGARQVLYDRHAIIDKLNLHFLITAHGAELVPIEQAGERASEMTVALTGAEFAVAETGTLMVGGRPGGWGLASVLPWVHLVVLRERDIVPDLHTGFARFRQRLEAGERDWVWITGPSRTADIGHTLVLGAHGPNALRVMVLP